jgi:hypothetical protein
VGTVALDLPYGGYEHVADLGRRALSVGHATSGDVSPPSRPP